MVKCKFYLTPGRKQLLRELWSTRPVMSYREIGRVFEVSDDTIGRAAKRMGLARRCVQPSVQRNAAYFARGRSNSITVRAMQHMTPEQIEAYRVYRRKKFSQAEAFAAVGYTPVSD